MTNTNKRIERIIKRAISYNNGYTTMGAFAILEDMDSGKDFQDDVREISFKEEQMILKAIQDILNNKETAPKQQEEAEPKQPAPLKFSITLEEFNALSLYEQNELYKQHPKEVVQLLRPERFKAKGKITKAQFLKLPAEDQSWYFDQEPALVKALLEDKLNYIDSEVFE